MYPLKQKVKLQRKSTVVFLCFFLPSASPLALALLDLCLHMQPKTLTNRLVLQHRHLSTAGFPLHSKNTAVHSFNSTGE